MLKAKTRRTTQIHSGKELKTLGLIINPIAGMGGRVGLKGTDGPDILEKARRLGAKPQSQKRTQEALRMIEPHKEKINIITCAGQMGDEAAVQCGFKPAVIDVGRARVTTASDTQKAVRDMQDSGVDLLLFAGGDGTARDIYKAVDDSQVVLGIPSGVKIHSAAFACNPAIAGELAALYLGGKTKRVREVEVMDIDEEDYRKGILSAKLYGYLKIPYRKSYAQSLKAGSQPDERYNQQAIAAQVVENMRDEFYYIMGPGSTTRAVMDRLELESTLLGVDLVHKQKLVGLDLNESELIKKINGKKTKLIITPIGGQGYLLGRGNQQISPDVLRKVGKENMVIIAATQKIHSFQGRPLLVDTGEEETDRLLSDYYKVITGYRESVIYKVSCSPI
jgi:predicted polyphosphate/ATP-dependent NAD kinase